MVDVCLALGIENLCILCAFELPFPLSHRMMYYAEINNEKKDC
jgi:hypothetical protein